MCICTRNRPADLATCLGAIARSTVAPQQVIVADDGDGARGVAVPDGVPVEFITGPRRGLSANRNAALGAVTSQFVLFVDDDCQIRPDYLAIALDAMRSAERGAGPGRVIVTGTESKRGEVVVAQDQGFLGFQQRPYGPGARMHSIVINATLFPAQVFALQRFDERLRYGYEEVDFASRAAALGYVITSCPEAQNDHLPSPHSRQDYAAVVTASRLYATFKRYRWTEHRRLKATAFAVIAPLHSVAAAVRSRERGALRQSLESLRLAVKLTRSYRSVK